MEILATMNLDFDLTNVQSDFLQYDGLLGVYRGGLGAGKTLILVLWALTRMAQGRYVLMSEPVFMPVSALQKPSRSIL